MRPAAGGRASDAACRRARAGRAGTRRRPWRGAPRAGPVEHEPPVRGREREPIVVVDQQPGLRRRRGVRRARRRGRRAARAGLEERARPRLERPDLPLELDRRPGRVEAAVVAAERPGHASRPPPSGESPGRSRRARRRASGPSSSAPSRAARASRSGARSVPGSGQLWRATIGARVDAVVHADDRDAGAVVTGRDRGRDRRRAPMARQERGVDVEDPLRRQVQERRAARSGRSRRARRGRAGASAISADRLGSRRPRRLQEGHPAGLRAKGDGRRAQRACRGRRVGPARSPRRRARAEGDPRPRRGSGRRTPRSRRRSFAPGRPPARGPDRRSCQCGCPDARRRSGRRPPASSAAAVGGDILFVVAEPDRDQLVHRVEVVDVQLAVEMVELVLERPTEEARAGDLDLAAATILGDDPDLLARVTYAA